MTADHVILTLPFAVLRTLDTSGANFDPLKKTAITQLGAGKNGKLQLQFKTRWWNTLGSNGNLYSDLGLQSGWDVTRAQSGDTGIIVDYSGGNVSRRAQAVDALLEHRRQRAGGDLREGDARPARDALPGDLEAMEREGVAVDAVPRPDPQPARTRTGSPVSTSGSPATRRAPQGDIHFAGEHCSQDFQGYMEGGAAEGARAAGEVLAAYKK